MTFSRNDPPYMSDKQINAFVDGVSTPFSVTVDKSRIMLNEHKKLGLEPGLFICRMGDKYHFLPRTKLKEKFTNAKGKIHPWQIFKVGDRLRVVEPHLRLTIAALAQGATVTINVSGQSSTFTFAGTTGTTLEAAASEMAGFINSDAILSQLIWAIADGTTVHVYSKDGITIYTVTTTGGTITSDPANGTMVANVEVGEIASFSPDTPGEITLTSQPSFAIPVGAHIGVPVDDILGYCHYSTDWSDRDSLTIAPIYRAHGTYEGALPYVDGDIKRRLDLNIRMRF